MSEKSHTGALAQGTLQSRDETLRGLASFFSESVHLVWSNDEIADCLTGMIASQPPAAPAAQPTINREILECARQAIEYSIEMGCSDPGGVLLQTLNRLDSALASQPPAAPVETDAVRGQAHRDAISPSGGQSYNSVSRSSAETVKAGWPFQQRVLEWLMACFSMEVCRDGTERNHRFLEEALELVQSLGCTRSEAHQLVDYVFARPVGEPVQELGGVMVTLAALCFPHDLDMNEAAERELARVWTKIDKIRAKQAAKPKHSPLPEHLPDVPQTSRGIADIAGERQRQVSAEGWTPEHDDEHTDNELALAALCYVYAGIYAPGNFAHQYWPWDRCWWKPADNRRNLVKAGALIAAEIDRLDRVSSAVTRPHQRGGE